MAGPAGLTGGCAVRRFGVDEDGGPLVALVHGFADDWRSWWPLVDRLGPGWRFRALDLPWAAGREERWSAAGSAAEEVRRGLEALGEPVDVLAGHSYGATAVLEVLAGVPAAPAPAAAVALAPLYRPPEVPVTWEVFDRSRRAFEQQVREGVRVRLGARVADLAPDVLDAVAAKALDRVGPGGFLAVFEQFAASGQLPLARVGVPTLVLAGRQDPTLGQRRAAALATAMPAATVELEDAWDHFSHVRHPVEVAARITAFLAAVDGREPSPRGLAVRGRTGLQQRVQPDQRRPAALDRA